MVYYEIVEKHSSFYTFLRRTVRMFFAHIYYRKFHVKGLENLPPSGTPVMIVSNHQNGLMDALAILFALPSSLTPIFMARADIFKKAKIAKILCFFKILPVFRQRDGRENLGENEELFNFAATSMGGGFAICLFPEGQHQEGHYLGQMKKGFARVVFSAAEKKFFPPDMIVIPAANHYKEYSGLRTELEISFGKPIVLANYYERYRENSVRAMVDLTSEVSDRVEEMMLNVPNKERYREMDCWREIVRHPKYGDLSEMKKADQEWTLSVLSMPKDKVSEMCTRASELCAEMKARGFSPKEWPATGNTVDLLVKLLCVVIYAPFALIGCLLHILPFAIVNKILKKTTATLKSEILKTTFSFVLDLIITSVIYIVYILILLITVFPPWWVLIEFVIAIILLRIAYTEYRIFFFSFIRQCRAFRYRKDTAFRKKVDQFIQDSL